MIGTGNRAAPAARSASPAIAPVPIAAMTSELGGAATPQVSTPSALARRLDDLFGKAANRLEKMCAVEHVYRMHRARCRHVPAGLPVVTAFELAVINRSCSMSSTASP